MKSKVETKAKIKLNAEKAKKRDKMINVIQISLLVMLLFLITVYFILKVLYETGEFTISLDQNFAQRKGLIMYESLEEKNEKIVLNAKNADFVDNISVKWLPQDINQQGEGSHNGDNYFAYTFYLENKGSETINYWYEVKIDDVIKNVDKAVRIMIYRNDEKKIYAKPNEDTGEAEEGTEKFYSSTEALVEGRKGFAPGEIDKFTIVIFIEGDDPDCIDELIGGEIKMHMEVLEEHIQQ